MKNLKRFLLLTMLIVLGLFVVGCSNDKHVNDNGEDVNNNLNNNEDVIEEEITFTVDFYVDDSKEISIEVIKGFSFELPLVPLKEGYLAIGWIDEEGALYTFNEEVNASFNLYAKYIPDYYLVINDISDVIMSSNVKILKHTYDFNSMTDESERFIGSQGSGVIFKEDDLYYYVLTNHHVTKEENREYLYYYIFDYKGNEYSGKLLENSSQEYYDLSVLIFKKGEEKLHIMEFEEFNPEEDDDVIAIGQPKGQNNTITIGKVLGYKLYKRYGERIPSYRVIKHDAKIDGGSSGGALINLKLKLVGINFAKERGEYYTIPIETIHFYLNEYVYE